MGHFILPGANLVLLKKIGYLLSFEGLEEEACGRTPNLSKCLFYWTMGKETFLCPSYLARNVSLYDPTYYYQLLSPKIIN